MYTPKHMAFSVVNIKGLAVLFVSFVTKATTQIRTYLVQVEYIFTKCLNHLFSYGWRKTFQAVIWGMVFSDLEGNSSIYLGIILFSGRQNKFIKSTLCV